MDIVQKAKRSKELKELKRDFPDVNPVWCEWMYDVVSEMSIEEQENIMNNKLWDTSGKYSNVKGETLKTGWVSDS